MMLLLYIGPLITRRSGPEIELPFTTTHYNVLISPAANSYQRNDDDNVEFTMRGLSLALVLYTH